MPKFAKLDDFLKLERTAQGGNRGSWREINNAKAEAARRKAAEQERQRAEAEQDEKVRAHCAQLYKATADKKLADLTVKEEQQVRACQALGYYKPER